MAGDARVQITVGEIAAPIKNALVGGPFGSDLGTADYLPSGVPVIRGQNLSNGKFVGGEFVFVSEEKADKLKANLARAGDLVFTQRGNAVLHGGQVAIVPEQPFERYLVSQSQMKLTPDQTKVDSRFLYFIFTSADYRYYLQSNAVVTGVPHINLGLLRQYSLSLPPLAQQRAVSFVLGALDDKIELNRRMNATLKAIVRTLFQSWFVDFDPVRAKLDGRGVAALDAGTAALFPDTFQGSEVGHIPNGWEFRTLNSLTQYLSRGIGPSYLERGGVCVLNQKCVRDNRVDFSKARRHDSAKKPINDRAIQNHDVLVNSTGMGTLGRVAQVFYLPEVTIVDSHVTIVRASSDTNPFFLGINLTGREDEIEELGEGSTGQTELSRARLGALKIITPPLELQKAFGALVRPILERITENENQSLTVATLRDTLLPKLLRGELDISKIAKAGT